MEIIYVKYWLIFIKIGVIFSDLIFKVYNIKMLGNKKMCLVLNYEFLLLINLKGDWCILSYVNMFLI